MFLDIESPLTVYQWHGDMWSLPSGAHLLATNATCPHQAFGYGAFAYGLQFHIEVTDTMIQSWKEFYRANLSSDDQQKLNQAPGLAEDSTSFQRQAHQIYTNFEGIIQKRHLRKNIRI